MALESPPASLDPRVATDQSSARVFAVLLNGLCTKDEQGNPLPDLAHWEILDGGRRYRFHLRPGVRFHDGR
ncbi:MAG: ABC transporter substrate-binding protein, partial [Thermoanaerobaculia bacterium]